jgi:hypothetical protein
MLPFHMMLLLILPVGLSMPSGRTLAFSPASVDDSPVADRHAEGLVHGFLVLLTLEGKALAYGDLIQTVAGDRVTSKLTFQFKDGSNRSETAIFSQSHGFRLLSDHVVEKGASFKNATETKIDASTGNVEIHYTDKDGHAKIEADRLELPGNLANGILFTLLKNIDRNSSGSIFSMVAITPKPRLVKLAIASLGEDTFDVGGTRRKFSTAQSGFPRVPSAESRHKRRLHATRNAAK